MFGHSQIACMVGTKLSHYNENNQQEKARAAYRVYRRVNVGICGQESYIVEGQNIMLIYERESRLMVGEICLHKSLCQPENWS